jgi:hypothetical protein
MGVAAGDGMADATGFGLDETAGLELGEGDSLCPRAPDMKNVNNRRLSPKVFLFL